MIMLTTAEENGTRGVAVTATAQIRAAKVDATSAAGRAPRRN